MLPIYRRKEGSSRFFVGFQLQIDLALCVHWVLVNSINPGRNMTKLQRFHQGQSGATIVEYAIMLALIAAVCFAAITLVGSEAGAFWGSNADQVSEIVNSNRAPIN